MSDNSKTAPHLSQLAHIPGERKYFATVANFAFDPTITVRDAAVGSQAAADAALVAALPGKIAIGIEDSSGNKTVGYFLFFI